MKGRAHYWLLIALLAAFPVAAQEDDADSEQVSEPETEGNDTQEESVEVDDESYLDIDEEDFTPSEEIPTDESIPFPTDI